MTKDINKITPPVEYKWFMGGVAGSVASIATHPLDLLKVRIQVAKIVSKISAPEELKNTTGTVKEMAEVSTTASQIIKSICKNEGVVGFYRGLTASVLRQLTYSSAFVPQMLCASAGGAVGAIAGNTFDLLNIRMQSDAGYPSSLRKHYKNALHGLWRIVTQEGTTTCFTGLPTNIQRAVIITLAQIVSYERAKGFLLKFGQKDGLKTHFYASMISGFVTVTVSNPVDVVKSVIMSSQPKTYKSGLDCAKTLLVREGPLYFMKGWWPSYIRLGPHTVITFITLEQLKKLAFFQKSPK